MTAVTTDPHLPVPLIERRKRSAANEVIANPSCAANLLTGVWQRHGCIGTLDRNVHSGFTPMCGKLDSWSCSEVLRPSGGGPLDRVMEYRLGLCCAAPGTRGPHAILLLISPI